MSFKDMFGGSPYKYITAIISALQDIHTYVKKTNNIIE